MPCHVDDLARKRCYGPIKSHQGPSTEHRDERRGGGAHGTPFFLTDLDVCLINPNGVGPVPEGWHCV
jgi:hypothetical protein